MLLKSPCFCSAWLIGVLIFAPAVDAQIFKGHPYRDQHPFVYGSVGTTVVDSIRNVLPVANNYTGTASGFSTGHLPDGLFPTTTLGSQTMVGGSQPSPQLATNALLRVWVDENAIVFVNDIKTKPQHFTGLYRSSRLFSLTGLMPDEVKEVVVQVQSGEGEHVPLEKTQTVQAGGYYEMLFQEPALNGPIAEIITAQPVSLPPEIEEAVQLAREAADQAAAAAWEANEAAVAAKQSQADAATTKAEIQEYLSEVTKLAAEAAQSAKQAARSHDEQFNFEQDHNTLVAYATYADDGSVSKLLFDRQTCKELVFTGTGGALNNLSDVMVSMNYYFTIGTSEGAPVKTFKLLGQRVSFDEGRGNASFFDADHPELELGGKFKEEIIKNWSKQFHAAMLIKVEIKAVRPNGEEAIVAPVGNRITIDLRHP